jgi:hypothetical protein
MITKIVVTVDGKTAYMEHFKGAKMSDAHRKIMRERIDKALKSNADPLVTAFHTMCEFGYRRVQPELEMFEFS